MAKSGKARRSQTDEEECPISPTMMLASSSSEGDLPELRSESSADASDSSRSDDWGRSGSGRDLSSDELLRMAVSMAEGEEGEEGEELGVEPEPEPEPEPIPKTDGDQQLSSDELLQIAVSMAAEQEKQGEPRHEEPGLRLE
eukprot:COSAG06_NODE_20344_length_799_cov_0.831429_2_plen_141_part_01